MRLATKCMLQKKHFVYESKKYKLMLDITNLGWKNLKKLDQVSERAIAGIFPCKIVLLQMTAGLERNTFKSYRNISHANYNALSLLNTFQFFFSF